MAEARVAFLGCHQWRAHEAVRWWNAAHGQGERASAESGASGGASRLDVFGIARAPIETHRSLVWQGLRPGADKRVAAAPGVSAVVCSGQGPNDVQIVKDCRRAGKAVFVESLERFQPGDMAELVAPAGNSPALMTGLYLRFDSVLQEAAELGIESVVGRPLLYQAHASTVPASQAARVKSAMFRHHRYEPVAPSLFELGMEQVDVLRFLLGAEPTEVYAAGTVAAAAATTTKQQQQEGEQGFAASFGDYQAVTLTIKTSSGVVASITLDACGGSAPRQRISVVGDKNRATFTGEVAAADLQEAGINHFLDVVTEGAPPRLAANDCLAAAAVMAAAVQSLRTGTPVAVCQDWSAAAAAAAGAGAADAVTLAAEDAASRLGGAVSSLVQSAQQLVQRGRKAAAAGTAGSGANTPPARAASEDGEESVSTPPHQGTPPPKAVSTPESPPLLPTSHMH